MDILPDELIEIILFSNCCSDMIIMCEVSKRYNLLWGKNTPYIIEHLRKIKNWHIDSKITLSRLKALCDDVTNNEQIIYNSSNYYISFKGKIVTCYNRVIKIPPSLEFVTGVIKIFRPFFGEILYLKCDGSVYDSFGKILHLENIIHIVSFGDNLHYLALSSNGDVFLVEHNNVKKITYVKDVINIFSYHDIDFKKVYFLTKNKTIISYYTETIILELQDSKQILLYNDENSIVLKQNGRVYLYNGALEDIGLNDIKVISGICDNYFYALSTSGQLFILTREEPKIKNLQYSKEGLFYKITIPINNIDKFTIWGVDLIILTTNKYLYSLIEIGSPRIGFYERDYEEKKIKLQGENIDLLPYEAVRIDDKIYGIIYDHIMKLVPMIY